MRQYAYYQRVVLIVISFAAMSCGSSSPASPSVASSQSLPENTFVITSSGVNPKTIQIQLGGRVTFTNNYSVQHEMASDDHPDHLDCPSLNQIGLLLPGQTRETGNFVQVETCSFHDHLNSTNTSLLGKIIVTE